MGEKGYFRRKADRARAAQLCAVAFLAVLLVVDAVIRQKNGDGWDFRCYYTAGQRLLHGEPIYNATDRAPFKYAPIVATYFVPYALFPYDVARWLWTLVHAALCLAAPALVVHVVRRDPRFRDVVTPRRIVGGLFVALIGSLRFLDSELFVSQATLGAYFGLPVAAWLVTTRRGKYLAPAAMGLGGAVKIHSLASGLALAPERSRATALAMLAIVALIVFVPSPLLWPAWWEQIRATTGLVPMQQGAVNLQGFYPFGVWFLDLPPLSILPALAALPFAAVAWLRLPRFTLDEAALNPTKFLMAASTWFLLGLLASPLPWQYTYSVLWPMLLLSWLVGTRRERATILGLALFLGLTPKGLAGDTIAMAVENRQLVFVAIVVYWVTLWRQAAVAKESSTARGSRLSAVHAR